MTNNQFRSTVHRVLINTADRDRYSIAFFYEPNRNAVVQVLPEFVSAERPAAYAPQTYGEYLDSKYAATHSDYKKASA
jgi:isopenicillin N synthase-like dioxygenase